MSKFIIDVDTVHPIETADGNKLFKAKGFASLVFDTYGLEQLERYEPIDKNINSFDEIACPGHVACIMNISGNGKFFSGFGVDRYGKWEIHTGQSLEGWKRTGRRILELEGILGNMSMQIDNSYKL